VRQWHRDFPALRTEGGTPGSEDAGIVAFLRERLVGLEDGEESLPPADFEAQRNSPEIHGEGRYSGLAQDEQLAASRTGDVDTRSVQTNDSFDTTPSIRKGGYRMDEIPLTPKEFGKLRSD
jgi:hypothetical protein